MVDSTGRHYYYDMSKVLYIWTIAWMCGCVVCGVCVYTGVALYFERRVNCIRHVIFFRQAAGPLYDKAVGMEAHWACSWVGVTNAFRRFWELAPRPYPRVPRSRGLGELKSPSRGASQQVLAG